MFRPQTILGLARSRRTETVVLLGFAIVAALVGFSGWLSAEKLSQFLEASSRNRYYAQVVQNLEAVVGDITEAESQQRAYLLTSDVSYLSAYDGALVQVREGYALLTELTAGDARLRSHIEDMKQLTERRLEHLGSGIHFHRTGDARRALEMMSLGRPLAEAIRDRFAQLQPEDRTALIAARGQVAELRADAIRSFVVTSALAAIVLAFMGGMVILEARFIRALADRMLHQSRHDELTALPNRLHLNETLARAISAAKRAREKLALLYLDLNGFKQVNDTLGHEAGDGVLVEVARSLQKIARESDFVARLGGDEFAVVMPRITDNGQVDAAAARFAALAVTRGELVVGASVGYAIYPDDAGTAEALLKVGDAAMYKRKQVAKKGLRTSS